MTFIFKLIDLQCFSLTYRLHFKQELHLIIIIMKNRNYTIILILNIYWNIANQSKSTTYIQFCFYNLLIVAHLN